jgi:hypothetical protein
MLNALFLCFCSLDLSLPVHKISSYGQNLQNSTYKGETVFCILICIMGLVFFSHLIGNMQVYICGSHCVPEPHYSDN